MDDQRGTKTIDVLTTEMSVDPVSTVLFNWDGVGEVGAWGNGALGDHGGTIELGVAGLEETVRVQRSGLVEVVDDVDDQGVVQGDIDGRRTKAKEAKRKSAQGSVRLDTNRGGGRKNTTVQVRCNGQVDRK